jgi:tRNA nucleotidyltransferase (CCA-adding enzyme)
MNNSETVNLLLEMRNQFSSEIIAFTRLAGTIAERQGKKLYLVGGAVRDLLLERVSTDIDLSVEGDAIELAEEIGPLLPAKITIHTRFMTATLKRENRVVDFITARAETYARPGALPKVVPGAIKDDMARRDFAMNAMAISLNPDKYGELFDPFGGRLDVDKGEVRVLHEGSFTDDATRIWRAIRYEQRLNFQIDPFTLLLIERDLDMLKTITGDRIRHELELVLGEEEPEKVFARADELGILEMLNPGLKGDAWLAEKFAKARDTAKPEADITNLYLALMAYRLTPAEANKLISDLRLPKAAAEAIKDTIAIKDKFKELSREGQAPSAIYNLLYGYCPVSYQAALLAADDPAATDHIELYESVLKHVRPALTGDDLQRLGVPKGPRLKEGLKRLLDARLDGLAEAKQDEEELVKRWVK